MNDIETDGFRYWSSLDPLTWSCKALHRFIKSTRFNVNLNIIGKGIEVDEARHLRKKTPLWNILRVKIQYTTMYLGFGGPLLGLIPLSRQFSQEETECFFLWINSLLDMLEDNLQGHLESAVLDFEIDPVLGVFGGFEPFYALAPKLASYNNYVEFHIFERSDRHRTFINNLSKMIKVISFTSERKILMGHHISDIKPLDCLTELELEHLEIPSDGRVPFSLPNLKKLHLSDQKDASNRFGACISLVFPNLKSIGFLSWRLSHGPKNIGLDELPISCVSLKIDYPMIFTISNGSQFLYLWLRDFSEFLDIVLEKRGFCNLQAISLNEPDFPSVENFTRWNYLNLLTGLVKSQPMLQVLAVILSTSPESMNQNRNESKLPENKPQSPEIFDQSNCEFLLSWHVDNETLLECSEIKLITVGCKRLYMKNSLDWRTISLMKYLEGLGWNLVWELEPTRLAINRSLSAQSYSQL